MSNLAIALEPRPVIVREAFAIVQHITADWLRSRALRSLLPFLPTDLYPEAVNLARALREPGARARALLGVAAIAPGEQSGRLALEAVEAIRRLPNPADRAGVLSGALKYLAGDERDRIGAEALSACEQIVSALERLRSLSQLPPGYFPRAFQEARSTADAYARAEGLSALARSAPEAQQAEVLAEALLAARELNERPIRARALAAVAQASPEADRPAIMAEAWAAAQDSDSDEAGGFLLTYFADSLPEAVLTEALNFARQLPEPPRRAATLISLLPRLGDLQRATLLPEILAVIQKIGDEWARGVALGRLTRYWPSPGHGELVRLALEISDGWAKASTLSDMAETLSAETRAGALRAALEAARQAASPWAQARALTDVAEQLPA